MSYHNKDSFGEGLGGCIATALAVFVFFYMSAAWMAFQWRNPTANSMSLYRDFVEVITWKKLPQYQRNGGRNE